MNCSIKAKKEDKFCFMHLGSVYTGPVGTVPYGTDRNCLELLSLYPVYTGLVPKSSMGFVKSYIFFKTKTPATLLFFKTRMEILWILSFKASFVSFSS